MEKEILYRIKPITTVTLLFGTLISGGLIYILIYDLQDGKLSEFSLVGGLGILMLFLLGKEVIFPQSILRKFRRGTKKIEAEVVETSVGFLQGARRPKRQNYVLVSFWAKDSSGLMREFYIKATVNYNLFLGLDEGQKVKIKAALEDPQIFLFEDEYSSDEHA